MNLEDAKTIIDCLPKGPTPFWYFRDRYALLLLSMLGEDVEKRSLKRTAFSQRSLPIIDLDRNRLVAIEGDD